MVKKAAANDMGELLSIDIDSLSIEEIETIEEIIDGPLDALAQPGARKGRMMRAMAVVLKRRTDPDFSIEDAGALRISLKSKPKDPTALSA
ncbi:hypothetical protein [Streptomyces sp. NRRL S-350]|uniref:hypothetical protein n=1 Tax=Streptomyces sp. NRRL S-350 TaxID=1463902 RepID=UPI0004BE8DF9|nr:hypothetical protein [Streptomyces sp. NRRL S-350]